MRPTEQPRLLPRPLGVRRERRGLQRELLRVLRLPHGAGALHLVRERRGLHYVAVLHGGREHRRHGHVLLRDLGAMADGLRAGER